jgi:hypothetical protein
MGRVRYVGASVPKSKGTAHWFSRFRSERNLGRPRFPEEIEVRYRDLKAGNPAGPRAAKAAEGVLIMKEASIEIVQGSGNVYRTLTI